MSSEKKKKTPKVLDPMQRMLKALAFLKPDRVPVLFFPEFDLMADFAEKKVKEYLADVDLQLETGEKFKERFSEAYCAVSIYQPYAVAQALGCKLMEPEDLIPSVIEHAIEKPSDVEKFKVPESVGMSQGQGIGSKKLNIL